MPKLNPIQLREVSEGIIQKVDNALSPSNSVKLGVNLLFHDDIGRAVLRKGTSLLGTDLSALSGGCKGLYQFIKSDGSKKLLAVFDGVLFSLEDGTWTKQYTFVDFKAECVDTDFYFFDLTATYPDSADAWEWKFPGDEFWSGYTSNTVSDVDLSEGDNVIQLRIKDATDTVIGQISKTITVPEELEKPMEDVRFMTFLDTVLALHPSEQLTSEDGDSWTDAGGNLDAGNLPEGKYAAHYLDKVYVSGVDSNPNRVYFSSLPDAGAISWTDETAGWFDVAPEDGSGNIIGLEKVPGYLLIFKERSIHRWNGKQLVPEALVNIGAQSNEGICLGRETVFFWNERGIFETNGGYPRKISRRIQDIVEAVDSSYKVKSWSDKENVYFSIGDIKIYGLSLSNCVIMYNIDNQVFSLLSFPNEMIHFTDYIDSERNLIAGDDSGNVWNIFDGVDDNGESINWIIQYQEQDIQSRSRIKDLSAYVIFTEKINNGTLYIKENSGDFNAVGTFREDVDVIKEDVRGNYFSFRLSGSGKSGKIIGIEIPSGNINFSHEL